MSTAMSEKSANSGKFGEGQDSSASSLASAKILTSLTIIEQIRHGFPTYQIYRADDFPLAQFMADVPDNTAPPAAGSNSASLGNPPHSPEGDALRVILCTPRGQDGISGRCSSLSPWRDLLGRDPNTQDLITELPDGPEKLNSLARSGLRGGNLHKPWSMYETVQRFVKWLRAPMRYPGLIRIQKNYRSGWCGYNRMNGLVNFEIVDTARTTQWLDRHYVPSFLWSLEEDPSEPETIHLTCSSTRGGLPIFGLFMKDTASQSTFYIYEHFQQVWNSELHNLMGGYSVIEKSMAHSIALAEKLRRRRGLVFSLM